MQGLLRFDDIFGGNVGQVPVNAQIFSATLELSVTNRGGPLELHRMLGGWSDSDTWNTLVAGIQANDVEAASFADAITGIAIVGVLSIDVTASVQEWASDPTSNHGWAILPTGTNGVDFDSAEGFAPPRLIVQTNAGTVILPDEHEPNDDGPADDMWDHDFPDDDG